MQNELTITRRQYTVAFDLKTNLFLAGIVCFSLSVILYGFIDIRIAQVLQFLSLISMCYGITGMANLNIRNTYFRAVFLLMMLWHVAVIVRGDFSYQSIKNYLFSEYVLWPFLVPLVALFVHKKTLFQILFDWLFYMGVAFILFVAFALKTYVKDPIVAEPVMGLLAYGSGFILLTWKYHSNTRRIVAVIAVVLSFVMATLLARRNIMLTHAMFMFSALLLFLLYYSKQSITQRIVGVAGVVVVMISAFIIFEQRKADFSLILNRATEDTREYVFYYFFDDIKEVQWTGRGIEGKYFCPLVVESEDGEPIYERDLIECGYLQILLKGGYINLILILMAAVPAACLGLFKSNNGFSKACAILILLWLIDMVPFGLPSFSIRYILVWLAIGVCYSRSIRLLSEGQLMKKYFIHDGRLLIRTLK